MPMSAPFAILGRGSSLAANLGTGQGTSIREVLETVKAVTGLNVPIVIDRGAERPQRCC